jgi:uncharacterized membrane protein
MRFLIALLAVAGIVVSSLALRVHLEDPSMAPPCAVYGHWDCGSVNHSRYAVFPPIMVDEDAGSHKHHVPVAVLGIIGYALIAAAALLGRFWITLQLAEIGFAFAAFLTYIEAYIMETWCIYCVWSQAIIATILLCTIIALVVDHRRKRRFAHSAVVASL